MNTSAGIPTRKASWRVFEIAGGSIAFGLAAGDAVSRQAVALGTAPLWSATPLLVVIMGGGLVTNILWCGWLLHRNRSWRFPASQGGGEAARNLAFCAVAGAIWYCQFMFYGFGSNYLGAFAFAGWSLHMGTIILFSTVWGILTGEWTGAGASSRRLNVAGLALLILAIATIGYAGFLQQNP